LASPVSKIKQCIVEWRLDYASPTECHLAQSVFRTMRHFALKTLTEIRDEQVFETETFKGQGLV